MSHVLNTLGRKGPEIVTLILGGCSGIYVCVYGTAHTFLIHQYQNLFTACDSHQVPISVPEKVKSRFKKVMDDLDEGEATRLLSKVFMSIRPSPFSMGFSGSKYGIRIGLPLTFSYENKSDINRDMKIESKLVDWNSPEGKLLEESLVLSEKAQMFVFAQELLKSRTWYYYYSLLLPPGCVSLGFFLSFTGRDKLQLLKKPIQARVVYYTLVTAFCIGFYCFLQDQSNIFIEKWSLRGISELGRDYIEGGIEYLDKQLKINSVLRTLTHDGEDTYAVSGNYNYFIRQKSLPLNHQKKYLENQLKELDEKSKESKK